jgi:(p)ppGpp synthase/HD superfamily hydrolase
MTLYSPRIDDALQFTADAFRAVARKGGRVPYLTHLLQVMVTVGEHGGDEDQLIAALLHDYLEDIPGADATMLRARFGERVVRMVEALSDATAQPKPPWEDRKRRYLRALAREPDEVKLISAADKLHNAASLDRDLTTVGPDVWSRFNAPMERSLWYYRAVVAALRHGWSHRIVDELEVVVRRIHERSGIPYVAADVADLLPVDA